MNTDTASHRMLTFSAKGFRRKKLEILPKLHIVLVFLLKVGVCVCAYTYLHWRQFREDSLGGVLRWRDWHERLKRLDLSSFEEWEVNPLTGSMPGQRYLSMGGSITKGHNFRKRGHSVNSFLSQLRILCTKILMRLNNYRDLKLSL